MARVTFHLLLITCCRSLHRSLHRLWNWSLLVTKSYFNLWLVARISHYSLQSSIVTRCKNHWSQKLLVSSCKNYLLLVTFELIHCNIPTVKFGQCEMKGEIKLFLSKNVTLVQYLVSTIYGLKTLSKNFFIALVVQWKTFTSRCNYLEEKSFRIYVHPHPRFCRFYLRPLCF